MKSISFAVARVVASAGLLFAGAAAAQFPLQPFGPPGGDVSDVAPLPGSGGVVLAGLDPYPGTRGSGGLFRSADGGATWSRVASVPDTVGVRRLAFASNGTAYAATSTGTWKSTDAGATWMRLDYAGAGFASTHAVAVSARNPQMIWVGVESFGRGVLRSADGGATWSTDGPNNTGTVTDIALDAFDDTFAIVASVQGIWVRSDGVNWLSRKPGLPAQPLTSVDYDGERVVVGLRNNTSAPSPDQPGLFASIDLGATWTPLSDATWPSRDVVDVAHDPANADTILAASANDGVFRSTDGGVTWQFPPVAQQFDARSVRYGGGAVWAGAWGLATLRSADGGATFAPAAQGMHALVTTSVAVSPLDANDMSVSFAMADAGGVWRTRDGGAQWQRQALPPRNVGKVAYALDGVPHAVIAGPNGAGGVYRAGANDTWTSLGPQIGSTDSVADLLTIGHHDPGLIYVSGLGASDVGSRLWRSRDGGTTWQQIATANNRRGWMRAIEVLDDGTDRQMTVTYLGAVGEPAGATRSFDGGTTWRSANSGLQTNRSISLCQRRVPVQTAGPTLFAAVGGSIKSLSAIEDSWRDAGQFGQQDTPIGCDPGAADVYVANAQRILRSGDGGMTFATHSSDLAPSLAANGIVVQRSTNGSRVYVATAVGAYATATETIFADVFETTVTGN